MTTCQTCGTVLTDPGPTLDEMKQAVYDVNHANGWFDAERSFGDDIALLHSEVSEMFEAYRDNGFDDVTEDLSARFDDTVQRLPKPEGFGSECADVLVRLLDSAYRYNEVEFSWERLDDIPPYSRFKEDATVGEHIRMLHLFIAQVDFLHVNLDKPLSYLVTWCLTLGIDLQAEFDRKLAYNKTRGHRHGGKLL